MEFGLGLMGYEGCWDDAAFAEEHGFSTAGFVDSPLLAGDAYVCMGLAARATKQMRIGTFIGVPGNRTAPTAAAAIATINHLAPGRTFLGLGTGFTGRNVFGLPPVSVKAFRRFASECQELLAGEETLHTQDGIERPIRFGYAENTSATTEPKVPVYLAAEGPKAMAAAAEIADGWITGLWRANVMENVAEVFSESKSMVEDLASGSGRDFSDSFKLYATAVCVLEPGESAVSERALAQVGPCAMIPFHSWADDPGNEENMPPALRDRLGIYKEKVIDKLGVSADRQHQRAHLGHLSFLIEGEAEVLTEEIVRMTTLTGTAEEIATRIRDLESRGVDNLSFWVPPRVVRDVVLDFESKVMPLL